MLKKKSTFIILIAIVVVASFSFKFINDHRERSLDEVISYKPKDYYAIGFIKDRKKIPEEHAYEWWTTDKEPIDELMAFLGQYRVKKVAEEIFQNNMHNQERQFEFTITHSKANPAIIYSLENHVHIYVGNYYEVINGPIDMEWIEDFNARNREKYN